MKRVGLFVLMLASLVVARNTEYLPYNSQVIFEDSLWVDSTETHNTKAFWIDNGAHRSLLIEARNDSSSGWANDTSAVRIKYMQVWPIDNNVTGSKALPFFAMLNSHANPDSTAKHPKDFILWDSLQIKAMDTLAVWGRDSVTVEDRDGNTVDYVYGDSIHVNQTSSFGAFEYSDLPIDYSPAACLQVKGKASNEKKGQGSFWRFRVFQELGIPTRGK